MEECKSVKLSFKGSCTELVTKLQLFCFELLQGYGISSVISPSSAIPFTFQGLSQNYQPLSMSVYPQAYEKKKFKVLFCILTCLSRVFFFSAAYCVGFDFHLVNPFYSPEISWCPGKGGWVPLHFWLYCKIT